MTNLKDILNNIKQNSYALAPFQVMAEAFLYYKKTFFLVITSLLLSFFAFTFIGSLILGQFITFDENPEILQEQVKELTLKIMEVPYFYYYLVFFAIFSALGSVLIAGFYKVNAEVSLGKVPSFLNSFKYFFSIKGLYVFIAHLLIAIVFMGITIPLKMMNLEMVSMAINWIVSTLTIFTIPLIIFGHLNPITALKNSIMVVNKQPIPIILTIILNYFFLISGLLFFVVGMLFVLPYLFAVYFVLYKQVIGFNLEEEEKLS
ncbi:hypothetical protein LNQ81_10680 [Myroides sp. M-43]|uniref:hypothetical protein n=1 Tax=Myroides oncorhynchi TaxID=2893756 RepID=UPI001E3D5F1D|nr:hypothetical protein [Myroides oncorhynchi]MCC9043138.1 hypothetical protein [Myroides oncorhynchi]